MGGDFIVGEGLCDFLVEKARQCAFLSASAERQTLNTYQ